MQHRDAFPSGCCPPLAHAQLSRIRPLLWAILSYAHARATTSYASTPDGSEGSMRCTVGAMAALLSRRVGRTFCGTLRPTSSRSSYTTVRRTRCGRACSRRLDSARRTAPPKAMHCTALHCTALHCTALHANSHKRYSTQLATCNVQHATCSMQHATYAHANLHARQSARHCTEACARWTRVRRNMHGSTSTTTTTSGSASTLCCAASGSRYAVAPPIV